MTLISDIQTADTTVQSERHGQPIIRLDDVSFGYERGQPIVDAFSWAIYPGETWGVLGPSGSGKTTLLYLLAGLRRPNSGAVYFRGERLTAPSGDVGLMLQDYGLLPWMTAERNVQLGLKIRRVPRRDRHRIRAEWLERMQIQHIAGKYPGQLSGGQRQRVALARVLALQTDVLLLDEPLSAVDELTRERLQKTLRSITAELGVTMILVTHSIEEAALLTDNVIIFPEEGPLRDPIALRSPFAGLLAQGQVPDRGDPEFQAFCARIRGTLGL
ncbi:MAG: ABC transporter ATP-binding protein [Chloroflexota bacterium]